MKVAIPWGRAGGEVTCLGSRNLGEDPFPLTGLSSFELKNE